MGTLPLLTSAQQDEMRSICREQWLVRLRWEWRREERIGDETCYSPLVFFSSRAVQVHMR